VQVLLATGNPSKLVELRRILAAEPRLADMEVLGLSDVPPYPEPAETELSFEGNALLKARAALAATGLPALADDSGLCVDALHGMPGVLSKRWSGRGGDDDTNNALLLDQLADYPERVRGAAFEAAVALCLPHGQAEHGSREIVTHGRMPGRIAMATSGDGGFGYDPLFIAEGEDRTNGELPPGRKDEISHRGQALRAMVPHLLRLA
jgi:XTP/dITP diphosphohydrolase